MRSRARHRPSVSGPLSGIAAAGIVLALVAGGSPGVADAGSVSADLQVSHRAAAGAASLQPRMIGKLIPFHHTRKMQMARYSKRHYGKREYRLEQPRVIVEHYTDGPTMMSAWWTMANNTKNRGESPGICTHFIIDKRGRIYRTAPLDLRCRHVIGLNNTAIGIEHVGTSDRQVMGRDRQRKASYRLTLWLMARYDIAVRNVIGHGESLLSQLRHERYRSWRCQTHTDFSHATMHRYRKHMRKLARANDVRVGPKPTWVDIGC